MAHLSLYDEGLQKFLQQVKEDRRIRDAKDQNVLDAFQRDKATPEAVVESCVDLQTDAGKKYGGVKVGEKAAIPKEWVSKILGNIDNFVSVGNFAMKGAPESVGMAWFAVKLALTAIQNNYALYSLFGSGLMDITEMMVIIKHYDRLYDERDKLDFKASDLVKKLFEEIRKTYAAMLDFAFSVKRHLSGGGWAHLRHGLKDFFGAEAPKFQAKVSTIADQKQKVLEASDGVFKAKTFDKFGDLQETVGLVRASVQRVEDFQKTSEEFYQTQLAQFDDMMDALTDIKANTKPRSRWEWAVHAYEENVKVLNPLQATSELLAAALDNKHQSTCDWIVEHDSYKWWLSSEAGAMLVVSGGDGVGKSTLLSSVWEHLDESLDQTQSVLLYFSCDMTGVGELGDNSPQSYSRIASTLMHRLYEVGFEQAAANGKDPLLLEECSRVFSNPKQKKAGAVMRQQKKEESLPELGEAWSKLCSALGRKVVLIIDAVERMPENDQIEFLSACKSMLASDAGTSERAPVRILAGCRSGGASGGAFAELRSDAICSIDMSHFNKNDMKSKLTFELERLAGWTEHERIEAEKRILDRAGSSFKYVVQVAVPFLQQPFQRPLSRRLNELPEGIGETYSQAISAMAPNYVQLLRTALSWTLFTPRAIRVKEIMDAFSGIYMGPSTEDHLTSNKTAAEYLYPSDLEVRQLRTAAGPFLEILEQSGESYVGLKDASQIRHFCLHPATISKVDLQSKSAVCAQCKVSLDSPNQLTFSERDGHLELAITCLRHLNNALFQKRFYTGFVEISNDTEEPIQATNSFADGTGVPPEAATGVAGSAVSDLPKEQPVQSTKASPQDQSKGPGNAEAQDISMAKQEDGLDPDDESMDDDDRGDFWLEDLDDDDDTADEDAANKYDRTFRYEVVFWYYHAREAERLWPSADERASDARWSMLIEELDRFAYENMKIFDQWQNIMFAREDDVGSTDHPYPPLQVAALLGLCTWAEHLIDRGESLNGSEEIPSALQAATFKCASSRMLRLLLGRGAAPNEEHGPRVSAFHIMLFENPSRDNVQMFLDHGANVQHVDTAGAEAGWSALHYFAYSGKDLGVFNLLMEQGPANINVEDQFGETPLHIMLSRKDVPLALLRAFMEHDADVNKDDKDSERPLYKACTYGDKEVMEILLPQITDVNDDNRHGRTALHQAAWQGYTECVKLLLGKGAKPNHPDKHQRTPLFFACLGESVDTIKLLLNTLRHGHSIEEINKPTVRGRTPLRQAAAHGFSEVVLELLLLVESLDSPRAAEMVNAADTLKGRTALHCAAFWGRSECIQLLLEHGADSQLKDRSGKTALELAHGQWGLAGRTSFQDTVCLLIDQDPVAAAADTEIMATAAVNGSKRVLEKLHGVQADLSRPDQYGWTPLMLAKQYDHAEVQEFLKQQTAWAGSLPTRWIDLPDSVTGSDDGVNISFPGTEERFCISANKPVPAGLSDYYFEVTSRKMTGVKQAEYPEMAIGFSTLRASALDFVGCPPSSWAPSARSWGYHGDDGGFGDSHGKWEDFRDLRYRPGDTVGCGVNVDEGIIWFTRNGHRLKKEFKGVRGRLLPLLGLSWAVELETNFGSVPFVWQKGVNPDNSILARHGLDQGANKDVVAGA